MPGTAIFLNRGKETAPLAMRANVEHNHVLHDQVIILAIETLPVPTSRAASRLEIDDLGYKETGSTMSPPASATWTPRASRRCCRSSATPTRKGPLDDEEVSYFLSTIEVRMGNSPGMSRWRKRLFIATAG